MSDNTFVAMRFVPNIFCPVQAAKILGYPTDQYHRKYPKNNIQIPVLLLHGLYRMIYQNG